MGKEGPHPSEFVIKNGVVIPLATNIQFEPPYFTGFNSDDFTSTKHFCDYLKGKAKKASEEKKSKSKTKGKKAKKAKNDDDEDDDDNISLEDL